MNKNKTNILSDIYTDIENGVFSDLDIYDTPWKEDTPSIVLDMRYHGNRSGEKYISPLLSKMLTKDGLKENGRANLAALIWHTYKNQWKRAWDALQAKYELLDNVKEETTETINNRHDKNIDKTGTDTLDRTGQQINDYEDEGNTKTENKLYGFNSSTARDTDQTIGESTSKNKNTLTNDHLKDETTHDTNDHDYGTDDTTRTLIRHGNIGVTSSQQMITQELELRKVDYFDMVFENIDEILTVPFFGEQQEVIEYERTYNTLEKELKTYINAQKQIEVLDLSETEKTDKIRAIFARSGSAVRLTETSEQNTVVLKTDLTDYIGKQVYLMGGTVDVDCNSQLSAIGGNFTADGVLHQMRSAVTSTGAMSPRTSVSYPSIINNALKTYPITPEEPFLYVGVAGDNNINFTDIHIKILIF